MSHTDKHLTEKIHSMGKGQMTLWKWGSAYGIYAFIFFFIGVWFAREWDTYTLLTLCLAVGATLILTFAIRYTVKRPRPDFLPTGYVPALKKYSFPSAHASTSFCLATAISLIQLSGGVTSIGLATVIGLFVLSILVSVSRIIVGVHYLTDVLTGAALGVLVSWLVFLVL